MLCGITRMSNRTHTILRLVALAAIVIAAAVPRGRGPSVDTRGEPVAVATAK